MAQEKGVYYGSSAPQGQGIVADLQAHFSYREKGPQQKTRRRGTEPGGHSKPKLRPLLQDRCLNLGHGYKSLCPFLIEISSPEY
jgi:hypothetical protein